MLALVQLIMFPGALLGGCPIRRIQHAVVWQIITRRGISERTNDVHPINFRGRHQINFIRRGAGTSPEQ